MPSYIDLPSQDKFSETIDKIIELKSYKRNFVETNINDNKLKKESLNLLKETVNSLKSQSKSFISVIQKKNNRNFLTEDNQFISGVAKPNATIGEYEIEILELASKQLLISEPIREGLKLKKGKINFEIGEEKIDFNFSGGTVKKFVKNLRSAARGLLNIQLIKKSADKIFIAITPTKEGYKNRIQVTKDNRNLFVALKIFKPIRPTVKSFLTKNFFLKKGLETNKKNYFFIRKNTTNQFEINQKVNFLETKSIFFRIGLVDEKIDPIQQKTTQKKILGLGSSVSNQVVNTPKKRIPKKSIRERLIDFKKKNRPLLILKYSADQVDKEKIFTWNQVQKNRIWINDINLKAKFDKEVTLKSVEFISQPKDDYYFRSWYQSVYNTNKSKYTPINEKKIPKPSRIKYFSIEIEKESNFIDDLIEGVELNLLKVSERPVKFSVKVSLSNYYDQIVQFINQYNYVIEIINIFLAPKKEDLIITKIDENLESKVGIFKDEFSVKRLKEQMRTIMTDSYPVSDEDRLIHLSELGLEVFYSSQNPYHIDFGKIKLNEKKLKSVISHRKEKIKDLFRFDKNGDFIFDDGFAFKIDKLLGGYLKPNSLFTSMGKNLVSEKKALDKNLVDENELLDTYRSKLERDFSKVKQIRSQQKGLEGWLNSLSK